MFVRTSKCQESFQALKGALTTDPILAYPKTDRSFTLHTDSPGWAVGAVLSQEDIGKEYVVAYYCRQMSKVEKNYSTTERKILAVITVVKEFYPCLYGCIL